MRQNSLLTVLDPAPVLGVSFANITLLRLDLLGGPAPGNKWFKLRGSLEDAMARGITRVVSFGGAWSNHLHALAAVGNAAGLETTGIIRGLPGPLPSAMLEDAARWGMQLVHVSRDEYRRRADADYQAALGARFGPCLVIPEGGASPAGVAGCRAIGAMLRDGELASRKVVLGVGTGTTLAGITLELGGDWEVIGISVLKGAVDLPARVSAMVGEAGATDSPRWRLLDGFHCGGFARVSAPLQEFILAFERVHRIPLEPVYTGKVLFAIHSLRRSGTWNPDTPLVVVHTGGLQGRRGFPWLSSLVDESKPTPASHRG
jgi:1-aminocyclopropane-1-carboxylate deaminase